MGFANEFVGLLAGLRFEHTFNPYADVCPRNDLPDAPTLRRDALVSVIGRAQETGVDSLWVGEAPGHLGARRTGLPFTDNYALQAHGERWGVELKRATREQGREEHTAKAVWGELRRIKERVFLWNAFPLHPHKPDDPLSNRSPRSKERQAGRELLSELIVALKPRLLVAIGGPANEATRKVAPEREIVQVRHPSHGGQREFKDAIRELYSRR